MGLPVVYSVNVNLFSSDTACYVSAKVQVNYVFHIVCCDTSEHSCLRVEINLEKLCRPYIRRS